MRKRLTCNESNSILLLYVGRLGTEKNLDILKEVLDKINAERLKNVSAIPDVRLAFVGSGPDETNLKKLFSTYPNVLFAGQMTGNLMKNIIF